MTLLALCWGYKVQLPVAIDFCCSYLFHFKFQENWKIASGYSWNIHLTRSEHLKCYLLPLEAKQKWNWLGRIHMIMKGNEIFQWWHSYAGALHTAWDSYFNLERGGGGSDDRMMVAIWVVENVSGYVCCKCWWYFCFCVGFNSVIADSNNIVLPLLLN